MAVFLGGILVFSAPWNMRDYRYSSAHVAGITDAWWNSCSDLDHVFRISCLKCKYKSIEKMVGGVLSAVTNIRGERYG